VTSRSLQLLRVHRQCDSHIIGLQSIPILTILVSCEGAAGLALSPTDGGRAGFFFLAARSRPGSKGEYDDNNVGGVKISGTAWWLHPLCHSEREQPHCTVSWITGVPLIVTPPPVPWTVML